MKILHWMASLVFMAMLTSQTQAAPDRIGDFTRIDHEGISHQLSKFAYQNAVVVITQANGCSLNQSQLTRYKILRTNWDHFGVSFIMLNAANDSRESIRQEDSVFNYDMPILLDSTQLVPDTLGVTKAGEVLILDPVRMTLLFRGPLDAPRAAGNPGTTDLVDVLQAAVDGNTRDLDTKIIEFEAPEDCQIEYPAKQMFSGADVPDYETEIAPILIERCTGCHVEGGIGPFAMNSHQMIQGWSPMIREVLMTRRMPPAQVDENVRSFTNSGNIPVEEVQKLVYWINAGSPRE